VRVAEEEEEAFLTLALTNPLPPHRETHHSLSTGREEKRLASIYF